MHWTKIQSDNFCLFQIEEMKILRSTTIGWRMVSPRMVWQKSWGSGQPAGPALCPRWAPPPPLTDECQGRGRGDHSAAGQTNSFVNWRRVRWEQGSRETRPWESRPEVCRGEWETPAKYEPSSSAGRMSAGEPAVRRLPTSSCHVASRPAYPAPHPRSQALPCLERVGRVGERLRLSYHPPNLLHFAGKCTEAAKTCALSLRKDLQPVLKLKVGTVKINQGGFLGLGYLWKGYLPWFSPKKCVFFILNNIENYIFHWDLIFLAKNIFIISLLFINNNEIVILNFI